MMLRYARGVKLLRSGVRRRQDFANATIAASRVGSEQVALSLVMAITKWSIEIYKFGAPLNGQIVRPTDGQDVRSHPIRTEEKLDDPKDNFRHRYSRRYWARCASSDRSIRWWWRVGWWWNGQSRPRPWSLGRRLRRRRRGDRSELLALGAGCRQGMGLQLKSKSTVSAIRRDSGLVTRDRSLCI